MKSFSLLAITALTVSGAAVAQTHTPISPPQTLAQAQTAPSGSSTYPSTSAGTSQSTTSTTSQSSPPAAPQSTPSTTAAPTQSSSPTPATSSSASTQSPAPTVVEQKVDLKTEPGPPADRRAARTEAVNALAWAKSEGCRSDPSPRDCVRRAQDDYRQAMAQLGGSGQSSSSVSGSGTSQANGSERGARSDRN